MYIVKISVQNSIKTLSFLKSILIPSSFMVGSESNNGISVSTTSTSFFRLRHRCNSLHSVCRLFQRTDHHAGVLLAQNKYSIAQWKRAWPITQRSVDRNHFLLPMLVDSVFLEEIIIIIINNDALYSI